MPRPLIAISLTVNRVVVLTTGFGVPILLSSLRFIPWPDRLVALFNAHILSPALWGTRHKTPLTKDIGIVPTRGQALFISYIILINLVFCSVGLNNLYPNPLFVDSRAQTTDHLERRVGVMALANMSLIVLYSGRNNILLYVTSWQRGTFLLLHRWVCSLHLEKGVYQ